MKWCGRMRLTFCIFWTGKRISRSGSRFRSIGKGPSLWHQPPIRWRGEAYQRRAAAERTAGSDGAGNQLPLCVRAGACGGRNRAGALSGNGKYGRDYPAGAGKQRRFLPAGIRGEEDLDCGRLAALSVDCPQIEMFSQLVYHRNKLVTPQMELFIRLLEERISRDRGLTKRIFLHILYSRLKKAWNGKKQSIIRPQRGNVTG